MVHIRQVWCTEETSLNKEAGARLDASSEFHFDVSLKDNKAGAGFDASSRFALTSKFHFDASFEFPPSLEFPFDMS